MSGFEFKTTGLTGARDPHAPDMFSEENYPFAHKAPMGAPDIPTRVMKEFGDAQSRTDAIKCGTWLNHVKS